MADRTPLKSSGRQLFLGLGGSALLLASLYLLAQGVRDGSREPWMSALVLINLAAAVSLALIVFLQGLRLLRQYRERELGSRLTVRLAAAFILLSLIPVGLVYYFSAGFLKTGIDGWFDPRIERSLDQALGLSRAALQQRMRHARDILESLRAELRTHPESDYPRVLGELSQRHRLNELTLYARDGRVLASHSSATDRLLGPRPPRHRWLQAQQGHVVVSLDTRPSLHIRLLAPVESGPNPAHLIHAALPVPERLGALASAVEQAYSRYHELIFLQRPLEFGFLLTLTLVVIQSVLLAAWAALLIARRLMEPLRLLALGTRAVAAGDYRHTLPEMRDDELGTLLRSFNDMTRRLTRARDETEHHRRELERQKGQLETLLSHLSSGVLGLDRRGRLHSHNPAAERLLGQALTPLQGRPLSELIRCRPELAPLHQALARHRHRDGWEIQLPVDDRILLCRGAALRTENQRRGGTVILIDDITAMIEAQRHAARSELARRLAHEIKNPLTPIQLAAERLDRRLSGTLPAAEEAILHRATGTIIAQVSHLKDLVHAFSSYAREPRLERRPIDLNALVEEIAELYRLSAPPLAVTLRLRPLPPIEADAGRLRQLLHNLLKNAREASEDRPVQVRITTQAEADGITLCVEDDGPGIPDELLERIFEPYLTTKPRGSGLGLAICRRIVEQHGGRILATNRDGSGARLCIHLPAPQRPPRPQEMNG